jgi:sugar phosphate isomerase/epimerase
MGTSAMKISNYSLNYARAIKQGQTDVFRFLATCRELGLEGASVHLGDLPGTGPDVLARVRRAYLDNFLSMAMFTVSTNYGRGGDAGLEDGGPIREAIRAASFLGAPLLRVFAGSAGDDRAAAWARAVSGVRRTCEEAAKVGLPVGLQNHNHGGLCATGADVLRLVKEVDHPNLTAVLDCGQFLGSGGASGAPASGLREDDLYESIRLVAPLARHVRVKFYRPRPDGSEPFVDYARVVDMLRAVHYAGFLDIVYEPPAQGGEPIASAMPRIVRFLRGLLRDVSSPGPATSGRYDGLDNARYFADESPRTETSLAFTEGPTVDGAGVVYFTNSSTDQILAWDPKRRSRSVFRDKSGQANGLIFDREGRLVACEASGRITRTDMATGAVTVLADGYNGHPLGGPNDLDIDGRGRIYFTSRLGNSDPAKGNVNSVYRIDPDGTVARILAAP